MAAIWQRHDDQTYYATLGKTLTVAIIYEIIGTPGWKVQIGKRSLKDKLATKEDAAKVAVAFAEQILVQCQRDLEELKQSAVPR